tara:strand:+ start:138 stop:464 length:327 start_codon:yes stop_codon:yes gene_type:complete
MKNKEYHIGEATITYLVDGEERTVTGQLMIPSLMFLADAFILAKGKKQIAIFMKHVVRMDMALDDELYWIKADAMGNDISIRRRQREFEQKQMSESLDRESDNGVMVG